ncbi:MAG: outer membrane beta-barrel protein [Xanthobacteraceae bacterium]
MPRRRRTLIVSGLALPALAAFALGTTAALAQTPPLPDYNADLLAPAPEGNPKTEYFRGRNGSVASANGQTATAGFTTPSRIGATPIYGTPPAFGAGNTGFDSTNSGRTRQVVQAPQSAAPAQAQPDATFEPVPSYAAPVPPKAKPTPPPTPPDIHPLKAANRPGAVLPAVPEALPVSNPPAQVYPQAAANRPGAVVPVPPAADFASFLPSAETPPPGMPSLNTLPLGLPQRPLPIAAGDPYAPLGMRAGSFLLYPAIELSGGYDSNPEAAPHGPPSSLFVVAPELQVQSDWSRHSLTADIKGSYDAYGNDLSPSPDRPYLDSTIDGRIDVRRDTQILLENRFLLSTENPGSPNLQAGLARLPLYTDVGGTLGVAHTFNRLQLTAKATFDSISYDNSVLTNGQSVSNANQNYNQYGGTLRAAYELDPGLRPFIEIGGDQRVYNQEFDASGLQRDSTGRSVKVGGDINLFGSLTGEIAAGYLQRIYKDPTLPNIDGPTLDGSLLWQVSALTSAKFTAATTVTESVLPGTSGELSRDFNLEVDHAFLLWLIGTGQVGYGHDDYVGLGRQDNRYFVSAGMTYKLSRELQLKGTLRQDWLTSNVTGVAYDATSFLAGVRLQR